MVVYDVTRSAKFSSWCFEEVTRSLLSEIGMDHWLIQGLEAAVALSDTAFTMSSPLIYATTLLQPCASDSLRNATSHEN